MYKEKLLNYKAKQKKLWVKINNILLGKQARKTSL